MNTTDSNIRTGAGPTRDGATITPGGLHLDDGGSGGVPVLFLHSGAGSTAHWAAQLAHLRRRRRAIALDLRGHGRSRPPADGDYTIPALAQDVAAAADFLALDRFVLVGHSLGGAAAVAYAGQHPERVAGLLLLDPASDGRSMPQEQKTGLMAALRSDAYQSTVEGYWASLIQPSTEAVRQRLLDDVRRARPEAVVGTLAALLDFDPVTPLRRYRGPQLSIITPLNEVPGAYHALVSTLPHRLIEGTGHWLQLDAPDRVNAEIDTFLTQLPAS
jgi:pimeloyl-ACP methyl ester carboxylesterase